VKKRKKTKKGRRKIKAEEKEEKKKGKLLDLLPEEKYPAKNAVVHKKALASEGLCPYRGFAPGPHWGLSSFRLPHFTSSP